MLLTWASQQQKAENDPFADYPLALDFKNQDYWFGGTKYALPDLPGYMFTDNVDNIPDIDGTGYHSTTAKTSRLSASINPVTVDVDHIWWIVATFDAASSGNFELLGSKSDGRYLGRHSNGHYGYCDDAVTDRTAADICPAGRSAMLIRRRAGTATFAYKTPEGVVTVLAEELPSAFGAPTNTFNIGMYKNMGLQANAKVEGVFIRTGIFSDADISAILAAA